MRFEFEGGRPGAPMVARLKTWPHHTHYAAIGTGETLQKARLELITMLARAIHHDPDPFGDLGNVAHISQVVKFLNALKDGGNEEGEGDEYRAPSDYFMPDQLSPEDRAKLPDDWEFVIEKVIEMISSWADYYPDEDEPPDDPGTIDSPDGPVATHTGFKAPEDAREA
jgi:hypothetical protein